MSIETVIKWYGEWPYGWFVEQSNDVECEILSNNNLGIHYGWVLTKLNKTDDKEVYFKKFLHVTVLGYREFWKHSNNIAKRCIQYAVITPYTRHKTLPFVVIETESLYAPVLFRELQRTKRKLDFFKELGEEKAWQELITCAKETDHTYSDKYLNYTFYSNKTPLWLYKFTLGIKKAWASFYEQRSVPTRVPVLAKAYIPNVTNYSYSNQNEYELYEKSASVAAKHGFLTEFPREHGIGVVDFQDIDWCSFGAFK